MALNVWTENSGFSLGEYAEDTSLNINLPVLNVSDVIYQVISGNLPTGVRIDQDAIVGTAFQVAEDTSYKFCIRASKNSEYSDRTFTLTITGPTPPEWDTPAGLVDIGPTKQLFAFDNSSISYQFLASDPDTTNVIFELTVGILPPGLALSKSGLLTGFIPEHVTSQQYPFTITVSDQHSSAPRSFIILVINDDYLRADNGVLMTESGVIHSDSFYVRQPIWLTPAQLTPIREGNSIMFPFLSYNSKPVSYEYSNINANCTGTTWGISVTDNKRYHNTVTLTTFDIPLVGYKLAITDGSIYSVTDVESLNDQHYYRLTLDRNLTQNISDDTRIYLGDESELPNGIVFDSSGALIGKLEYQAISDRTYRFTILAVSEGDAGERVEAARVFSLSTTGRYISEFSWLTESYIGELQQYDISYFKVRAASSKKDENITYSIIDGTLPPGLALQQSGEIYGRFNPYNSFRYRSYWSDQLIYSKDDIVLYNDVFYIRIDSSDVAEPMFEHQYWSEISLFSTSMINFDEWATVFDQQKTTFDQMHRFLVRAKSTTGYSYIEREFMINGVMTDIIRRSNVMIGVMSDKPQRDQWRQFVDDETIFPNQLLYRPDDLIFGRQHTFEVMLFSGINFGEVDAMDPIVAPMTNVRFGLHDPQSVMAVDKAGGNVYEVVYFPIFEHSNSVNSGHIIDHWRDLLRASYVEWGQGLPLWMQGVIGFQPALVACYCKPGSANRVLTNIKYSGFDYKTFSFVTDRFEIEDMGSQEIQIYKRFGA